MHNFHLLEWSVPGQGLLRPVTNPAVAFPYLATSSLPNVFLFPQIDLTIERRRVDVWPLAVRRLVFSLNCSRIGTRDKTCTMHKRVIFCFRVTRAGPQHARSKLCLHAQEMSGMRRSFFYFFFREKK